MNEDRSTHVRCWRAALGPLGAGMGTASAVPAGLWRTELPRLEALGYRAAWPNEGVGGRDALAESAVMLAANNEMVIGTGIANIWMRLATTMQAGGRALAEAYPDRFVLGLGVSVAAAVEPVTGQGFDKPAQRMREYLQRMLEAEDEVAVPRLIAAMGPRMLEVAAEDADGAIPSAMPVTHTAYARSVLGPDKLLVVGVAAYLGEDVAQARAEAKSSGLFQIPGSPYVENYRRLGYDLTAGPTDQLVTDAFAIGGPTDIASRVIAHLEAGADHVIVQVTAPGVKEMVTGLTQIASEFPT